MLRKRSTVVQGARRWFGSRKRGGNGCGAERLAGSRRGGRSRLRRHLDRNSSFVVGSDNRIGERAFGKSDGSQINELADQVASDSNRSSSGSRWRMVIVPSPFGVAVKVTRARSLRNSPRSSRISECAATRCSRRTKAETTLVSCSVRIGGNRTLRSAAADASQGRVIFPGHDIYR